MKRRDLMRALRKHASKNALIYEETEGSRHTQVRIGENVTHVPRHSEIDEMLAQQFLKQAGVRP